MQRKSRLLFVIAVCLGLGICVGCSSGPWHKDDTGYREIERNSDRNSAILAITGAELAASVECIDDQASRVRSELNTLETAIERSELAEVEKNNLLHQASVARREAETMSYQVSILRGDAVRLNDQLAEQRAISSALSAEYDKREVAASAL